MVKMQMLYQVYQQMIFSIRKERNYTILNSTDQYYKTDEDYDIKADAAAKKCMINNFAIILKIWQ